MSAKMTLDNARASDKDSLVSGKVSDIRLPVGADGSHELKGVPGRVLLLRAPGVAVPSLDILTVVSVTS